MEVKYFAQIMVGISILSLGRCTSQQPGKSKALLLEKNLPKPTSWEEVYKFLSLGYPVPPGFFKTFRQAIERQRSTRVLPCNVVFTFLFHRAILQVVINNS
jgi:hypothetical protein